MSGIIFCVCSTWTISAPSTSIKRSRKEHKKMQVNKELQQNRSRWRIWSRDAARGIRTCLPRLHLKTLVKTKSESQKVPLSSWNVQQSSTGRSVLGASSSNSSERNVDEKWSSQEWKSGEISTHTMEHWRQVVISSGNLVKCREQVRRDPHLTSWSSMTMMWTLTPPQNRTFLQNPVHSWIEWMIDCERCWTVLQKIQCKTLINVLWFEECLYLQQWKHLYSCERITQTTCIPSKMFEKSEQLISEQLDDNFGVSQISWWRFSMETIIFGQWWLNHQSLSCKGLRIFKFCVTSRKDESEPNIKYCLGATVGLVQRFITIQNFGQLTENRWNSSGIFPRIHHIAARPRSPKAHERNGRARTIRRTHYLHDDVQWHHMRN